MDPSTNFDPQHCADSPLPAGSQAVMGRTLPDLQDPQDNFDESRAAEESEIIGATEASATNDLAAETTPTPTRAALSVPQAQQHVIDNRHHAEHGQRERDLHDEQSPGIMPMAINEGNSLPEMP